MGNFFSAYSKADAVHNPIIDQRNLESLRSYLRSYNPPRECVGGYLNILLFGMVGAGKSSTINTFLSALHPEGRMLNIVPSGSSDQSFTLELRSFTPETLKFRFWDAPGLCSKDYEKNAEKILTMILDGRLPPKTKIKDLYPDSECKYPVIEENKMHGVAFVFNLETVDNLSADVQKQFRKLQTLVGQKYLYRIVIGTHFDRIGIGKNDEACIYQYKALQAKFAKLSEEIKMEKRVMFAISNDLQGGNIEMTKAVLALYTLENLVRNLDLFFKVMHQ